MLAELAAMLSAGETELGTAISQLDQHLRETEKRTRAAIAEMEATCDCLESAIKACRRSLKELAETAVSDVKEAVHAGKVSSLATPRETGVTQTCGRTCPRGPKSRDIVTEMSSVMKTRVDDLDFSVTLPADAKVVSMVTLVIDPEAVALMERMLLELGQVMVVPADVAATKQVDIASTPEKRASNTRFFFREFPWRVIRISKHKLFHCASRSNGVLLTSLPQDR